MVVFGHCNQHLLELDRFSNHVYIFIYTFHMPLFMMVSGYFAAKSSSMKLSAKNFLLNKSEGLLLPIVTYSLVITLFYLAVGRHGFQGIDDTLRLFLHRCWAELWFLKALFLSYTFFYFCKHCQHKVVGLIATLILSQFIRDFNFNIMYPCFLVGVATRHYSILTRKATTDKIIIISGIVFTIMAILWCVDLHPDKVDMGYTLSQRFVIDLYRTLMGITGSLFIIAGLYKALGSHQNEESSTFGRSILYVGRNTLEIYILQSFILEIVLSKVVNLPDYQYSLPLYNILFIPISFAIIALCLLASSLIKNNSLLEALVFGK